MYIIIMFCTNAFLIMNRAYTSDKLTAAANEVTVANHHIEECRAELDLVNRRMEREIDRFKAQKCIDMKKMTHEYVKRQIEYTAKVEVSVVMPHHTVYFR